MREACTILTEALVKEIAMEKILVDRLTKGVTPDDMQILLDNITRVHNRIEQIKIAL
jgi:hypothetical protein